jgi:HPr kinase/phosphorylase
MNEPHPHPITGTAIAVAIDSQSPLRGVLVIGAPGSGKTDLAIRLIGDCPWQRSRLVADDQTLIELRDNQIVMAPPAKIKGLLEMRGIGITPVASIDVCPLVLIVETVSERPPRLPEAKASFEILGRQMPKITLLAQQPSAPARLRLFLQSQ